MSIVIKGLKIPKEGDWRTVRIYPDGTCAIPNWQGDCTFIKGVEAIELPPHGRLIDADAFSNKYCDKAYFDMVNMGDKFTLSIALTNIPIVLNNAPTILEAEVKE